MKNLVVRKVNISYNNYLIEVSAPQVAQRFKPGQFVIVRVDERAERIPLTVADVDVDKGTIVLIFQAIGKSTRQLGSLNQGDEILDCVGPLGKPSEIGRFGRVVVIGGGTGIACIYPIVKALAKEGNEVVSIIGARTESLLILENEITAISHRTFITTDDGSKGLKGFVPDGLTELIREYDAKFARVYVIGPPVMMKIVADITKPYGIKTIVSLNSVMLDGTGMCGSCRVFIDGEMKLSCIDGPEFDGHKVNYHDLISRLKMFEAKEKIALDYYQEKTGLR